MPEPAAPPLPLIAALSGGTTIMPTRLPGTTNAEVVRLRPSSGSAGRLANLSVRSFASAAEPLIAGFVAGGAGELPVLALFAGSTLRVTNDHWAADLAPRFLAAGAFPLQAGSRDAAAAAMVGNGAHSLMISPAPGATAGTMLAELYELPSDPTATPVPRFANLSARGPPTSS